MIRIRTGGISKARHSPGITMQVHGDWEGLKSTWKVGALLTPFCVRRVWCVVCADLCIFLCSSTLYAPGHGDTTWGHNSDQSCWTEIFLVFTSDISEEPQDFPCSSRAMHVGHLKEDTRHGSCFLCPLYFLSWWEADPSWWWVLFLHDTGRLFLAEKTERKTGIKVLASYTAHSYLMKLLKNIMRSILHNWLIFKCLKNQLKMFISWPIFPITASYFWLKGP